ncbi:hypothetical protein ACIRG5_41365 [Lentzea sp. NPDC102401]|uniref:hypothetical protein n=1 Tax=Lentzea sp. NPDC102401 TaxID=3364128 RepID=UPI0037F6BE31
MISACWACWACNREDLELAELGDLLLAVAESCAKPGDVVLEPDDLHRSRIGQLPVGVQLRQLAFGAVGLA